jgi:gliding motility-associated-like protein
VTINPSAGVFAIAIPTQPTCGLNNGSISVSPAGAIYNWTGGLSGNNPVDVSPGTYTVTVTAPGGCTDETTVTINPSAGVTAIATPTQPTCGLNNGSISVSPAGAIYNWTGGLSGSNPVNVSPGTYTVTVTAPSGCTDETTVTINPSAGVTVIATPTQPTCGLNNGSISVSPAGAIYNWTGGLSGSNPVDVSPGTYTVTVTASDGCSAINIVTILPSLPVNADAGADQSICYGDIATLSASGGSNFSWSDGLGNQAIVNTQPLFSSSSFIVTVTEGVCIDTDTINMIVTQVTATIISSGDSVNFIQNNPIQLTATGGDTFLWSHNLGQSNIVEVSPIENTVYSVTVTDLISGCSSTADINVIFNDLIKKYIIITPNNDGLNDVFIIPDLADFPNSAIIIYNRWGSIVWKKQPYENDWRGQNMMEQELPEGTYYYVIKLNNVDGDIRRGSITIKR